MNTTDVKGFLDSSSTQDSSYMKVNLKNQFYTKGAHYYIILVEVARTIR